ncbi:MAG TPA: hypothetical protein VF214_08530 [Edaphobacter sp.]
MNHLTEYQLIEHYYGESENPTRTASHLSECTDCANTFATLSRDLSEIQSITPPECSADYGAQVWQSIRNSVAVHEPRQKRNRWFSMNLWSGLSFATAALVLLAAAFFAGRQWEHRNSQSPANVATASGDNGQVKERVVLLVLGDHLDRSERLLVSLKHADTAAPVQAEARDLLAANRLYRESAAGLNDPALTAALDRLERVLIEVANQPGELTPERLDQLQRQMNTDGLLFEVRVLRSHVNELNQNNQTGEQNKNAGTKGVSI